jgi:hypothetical protein
MKIKCLLIIETYFMLNKYMCAVWDIPNFYSVTFYNKITACIDYKYSTLLFISICNRCSLVSGIH